MPKDFSSWVQSKVEGLIIEKKKKVHKILKHIAKDWYSFFKYTFLRQAPGIHSRPGEYPIRQSGDLLEGLRIYASQWDADAKSFRIYIVSKAPHTTHLVRGTPYMEPRKMFQESKIDFWEKAKSKILNELKKKN